MRTKEEFGSLIDDASDTDQYNGSHFHAALDLYEEERAKAEATIAELREALEVARHCVDAPNDGSRNPWEILQNIADHADQALAQIKTKP